MPQSLFMAMPAAVLFATVFSIVTFTRHSEITAAKASGVSFYRIIAPIMLGALLAAGLDLVVAEVVPITDARRSDLLQESKVGSGTQRYNFVYAAEFDASQGADADATAGRLEKFQIDERTARLPERADLAGPRTPPRRSGGRWEGVNHPRYVARLRSASSMTDISASSRST
jgi:hypothetical protein